MSDFETIRTGWYLLKSKVREEVRALENLENQGFEAYCPQFLEKQKPTVLFPGYLFVHLTEQDLNRYHKIRNTRGVSGTVMFNKMHQKSVKSGARCDTRERLQQMLPQPIPGGDQIIDDIEMIIWNLNGCKEEQKPANIAFEKGEIAIHSNPLFQHLKFTFETDMKSQRGIFLVEYIKQLRAGETVENQIISRQKMCIDYKDLKKA